MSWRDIPLPKRMNRLPRERHGFPVPFVAHSVEEQEALIIRIGTKKDGVLEGLQLVSQGARVVGPTTAILGQMHEDRQREAHLHPRCQVCALELPKRGPWYFAAGESWFKENRAFIEPAVCLPCMKYALQVCPGLVRGQRDDGDLRVYEVQERLFEVMGGTLRENSRVTMTIEKARALTASGRLFPIHNVVSVPFGTMNVWTPDEFLREGGK